MTRVIDSSAILAVLQRELIADDAFDVIAGGIMSAVNVAEVYSKLIERQKPLSMFDEQILLSLDQVKPFTSQQARRAGELNAFTRRAGLSLGDRACLALAIELNAEVYTTDRAWATVDVGVKVHLLR